MKTILILSLLHCAALLAIAQQETKDLDYEENEDLERKHRKRKKHYQNNNNPCGGSGRTFGAPEYTYYISAPVMNFFFGCGVGVMPQYPPVQPNPYQQPYPIYVNQDQMQGYGYGQQGYQPQYNGQQQGYQPQSNGQQQGYQQVQNPYYRPQRPLQGVVSAAASGLGAALADYFKRPRKSQRPINQFLQPIYKLL